MSIAAGTKLGPYEILTSIGAGGMGEVYQARDTRLGRVVALKVSATQFTERFDREARAVAALNHPNICTLHDVGPNYLVMEYIEGSTLAERIAESPIPLSEALPIARQLADALEAAHEKGIIHRDLKPANIKLTPDGKVKVLDFGLAKATEPGPAAASVDSPTLSLAATRAGVILGTAAYMSPEQARGSVVDKRSDIWAYGIVLYEMLTGRHLFGGETVSDTLAAVLRDDIDLRLLPPETPASIRRLLRRCLERDRKRRLPDIAVARLEIDDAQEAAPVAPAPSRSSNRLLWAALAVACTAAVALAVVHFREASPSAPMVRFQIPLPAKTKFAGHLALSPNGRVAAFAATGEDDVTSVWVRPLDTLEARQVPGTEGAGYLFWSPDSRFLAFWSSGKLRKVDVSGTGFSPVQTICETTLALGGSWSRDGVIIFGGNLHGIYRVPASGGEPSPVTQIVASDQERYHAWPTFLPDGKHFVYLVARARGTALFAGDLNSTGRKFLTNSRTGAFYVPARGESGSGYLLFAREASMMAQPFDDRKVEVTGEAFPTGERVGGFLTRGYLGASSSRVVLYRAGVGSSTQLEWFDREGKALSTVASSAFFTDIALPRAGTRIAATRGDTGTGSDLWLIDSERGTSSRFTFEGSGQTSPVWSPDGEWIAYSSGDIAGIFKKRSSGSGDPELLLRSELPVHPCDWSSDGKYLLYNTDRGKTRADLWVLPLEPGGKPSPYLQTEFNEVLARFSPDVHWVAYSSDESGHSEVYVQSFPAGAGKWQISNGGGSQPRWRADGRELYYVAPNNAVMAVDVDTAHGFHPATPRLLFHSRMMSINTVSTGNLRYAPTADGKRFVMITAPDDSRDDNPITVILNWQPTR